jgi:RNA-binding protein YlmH
MSNLTKEQEILINHLRDLSERAAKTGYTASVFLAQTEVSSIANAVKTSGVRQELDGGHEGAERIRIIFVNADWGEHNHADLFGVLRISWRKQDELGHRDILGTLMSLGIERKVIGDIIVADSEAFVICLPEMADYIKDNVTKIRRFRVVVERVSLDDISTKTEDLTIKSTTVASKRLDVVVGAGFNMSRTKVAELIAAGLVSVNHVSYLHPEKQVESGAIISVKGFGRVKVVSFGNTTRKGRIVIEFGIYGR